MIRKDKYTIETCSRCKRPGWTRKVFYNLYTEEEQNKVFTNPVKIKNAPSGAENCYVSMGSSIYKAIKEGKELAKLMNKQIVFEFNDQTVIVNKDSDVDIIYRNWWINSYGETPEESFKKR